jgi:hypothetical protein
MSVVSVDDGDTTGGHVKIGAPSHVGRNLGFLAAAGVLVAAIVWYNSYQGKQDAARLETLEGFRAAYAQQCSAPAWSQPLAPVVRDTYLNSSGLQAAVDKQYGLLRAGASCDDVAKALKAADFPLPQALPAQ